MDNTIEMLQDKIQKLEDENMKLKELAYRVVFEDLLNITLFTGVYDATNGDEHFMYGIDTVMSEIAIRAGEESSKKYANLFSRNMGCSLHKTTTTTKPSR